MFSLISADDCKVMVNSRFVKNAVFYKDLFAFFDTYEKLMAEDKKSLPSFCVDKNGKYNLEGICLFMKLYASELGFETLRLSLDYLRVIYYTIAGYTEDKKTVDRKALENEFNEYKKASFSIVKNARAEIDTFQGAFEDKKKKYDKNSSVYAKKLILARVYNALAVTIMIVGIVAAMFPFTFYFMDKFELKTAIIASGIIAVATVVLAIIFNTISKRTEVSASDMAYVLQGIKKEKDTAFDSLRDVKNKSNRIISEKYEYLHSISDSFSAYTAKTPFEKLLEKANEYNLKSYNLAYDVNRLFKSQQQDIVEVIADLNSLAPVDSAKAEFVRIYKDIQDKDWLYYNSEVRFTFLKKFVENSEKTHDWALHINDTAVNPFGIDIKSVAKEEIAYLKSNNDLFVASSLDKFLNTKYAKELQTFELKGGTNAELLKNIKVDYIDHFFDYNTVKEYNNLFYDKKIVGGVKVTEDIRLENEKIPTYIFMKIKLLENSIGLGNSDSAAIKQIASELKGIQTFEEEVPEAEVVVEESKIMYPSIECEVEDIDENTVRYVFGDKTIIGYKLARA